MSGNPDLLRNPGFRLAPAFAGVGRNDRTSSGRSTNLPFPFSKEGFAGNRENSLFEKRDQGDFV
jgi:hypothetical protein